MIPIELKPFSDETIGSWIIRNSIANGSDPISWASGIWPDWRIWTRDIDRFFPIDKAYELSKITSLSIQDIQNMTLEPLISRLEGKELNLNSKWKWVIPTGERGSSKVNGMHFCPKCLSESVPHLKKQWRLSWNTTCSKHKCLLLLHCPSCNNVFLPNKIDYSNTDFTLCTHCKFDLKNTKITTVEMSFVESQEEINAVITQDGQKGYPFELTAESTIDFFITFRIVVLFFHRLNHTPRQQKIVLEKLGLGDESQITTFHKGNYFDSLDVEERYRTIKQAISLLKLSVDEVVSILSSGKISQQMLCGEVEYRTKYINNILNGLEDRSRSYSKRKIIYQEVKPKSMEEVLAKMAEIKEFL